ncbi:MAG: diaminopimelate decarboxylase [bacterium]|nr:diaminopimelate decarboxylase [bacterium]
MKSFARWRDGLAPGHERDASGTLRIGGIAAHELAQRFDTPALCIDLRVLDDALNALLSAARAHEIGVSYAGKALLLPGLARHLQPYDIGIDVSSLGELVTVERAAFPAARVTLHGAGKSAAELDAACERRVGRIVADSLDELRALGNRTRCAGVELLLRLNTGIEAHTHEFVRTAGDESKFGIAPHELDEALALAREMGARLRGLHAHIGSQIADAAPFVANAQALLDALARVHAQAAFADADTIVVGGGFGVAMHADESELDIAATLAAIRAAVPANVRVEIEPGRAAIAAAGTSLYRVLAIKRFERRRYAIVDGSMADNPRPALYGASHHIVPVRASDAEPVATMVSGRSCENDRLGEAMLPADLRAGDLLAFCTTGAYTYSMASNYNRFPRPPVIALGAGDAALWARRESLEDVLRADT